MAYDPKTLKDILVCPSSKSKLVFDADALTCTNPECRLRFEIRDKIPILLIDLATKLSPEAWNAAMQKHGIDVC